MAVLVPLAAYAGSWYATIQGVSFLFDRVEKTASPDLKITVSRWLQNGHIPDGARWPDYVARAFDHIFGKRHLSWACFGRSCVASVSLTLLTWLLLSSWAGTNEFHILLTDTYTRHAFVFALLTCTLPDYLCLLETRLVLGVLRTRRSLLWLPVLLAVDGGSTLLLAIGAEGMWIALMLSILPSGRYPPFTFSEVLHFGLSREGLGTLPYVSIGGLVTSPWVWLYFLAAMAVKVAHSFEWGLKLTRGVFDTSQPFASLGSVAMALVSLGFLVALPFLLLHVAGS